MAGLEEYVKKSSDTLNDMYDQQKTAQLAQLQQTYDQGLSDAQAARAKIAPEYQKQANDLGVQYERNRQNLNRQAALNGLNTGTHSQMQLAANNAWMKNYGALRTAQANALTEADRGINDLKQKYLTQQQAITAGIEAQRAQALYERQLSDAQTRAGFGDFSGFLQLGYDQATIDNMRKVWIAQNPLLAYNIGAITADEYYKMTGQRAPGQGGSASSYYGGGYGDDYGTDSTATPQIAEGAGYDALSKLWGIAKDMTKGGANKAAAAGVQGLQTLADFAAKYGKPAPRTSATGNGNGTSTLPDGTLTPIWETSIYSRG